MTSFQVSISSTVQAKFKTNNCFLAIELNQESLWEAIGLKTPVKAKGRLQVRSYRENLPKTREMQANLKTGLDLDHPTVVRGAI